MFTRRLTSNCCLNHNPQIRKIKSTFVDGILSCMMNKVSVSLLKGAYYHSLYFCLYIYLFLLHRFMIVFGFNLPRSWGRFILQKTQNCQQLISQI